MLQSLFVAAVDTLIVFIILFLAKKLRDARFRASFNVPSGGNPAEFTADGLLEILFDFDCHVLGCMKIH